MIAKEKIPYTLQDESSKKIYALYTTAKEKGNQRFCDAVSDYAIFKWLMSKKHVPKELQLKICDYLI